jgi:hypothetical protein
MEKNSSYFCLRILVFLTVVECYNIHSPWLSATYTVRSESHCALGLRYVDLVVGIEIAVEVCCCCVTLHCIQSLKSGVYSLWFFQLRKVFFLLNTSFEKAKGTPISHRSNLLKKLNELRTVWTLVDNTSNTFYKCTATFRTYFIKSAVVYLSKVWRCVKLRCCTLRHTAS